MISISYDTENNIQNQLQQCREKEQASNKILVQLQDLRLGYEAGMSNLDSPLEKSIAILSIIRTDPGLSREHFDSIGHVLTCLNSSDLTTPQIERRPSQIDGNFDGAYDDEVEVN